jgi:GTP cyclohydrolase I
MNDHAPLVERLAASGISPVANANISPGLSNADLDVIEVEAARHVRGLLECLGIDIQNDPHTRDTPARVARMMVREVFAGRYQPRPELRHFPNGKSLDEILAVGPVVVRSCCAHHLVPIHGQCWIAAIPGATVVGLSKCHRLVDWVMSRPQIQEEATVQLADEIAAAMPGARAVAVVVRASHMCCTWRGVRDAPSLFTTSVMRGLFKEDPRARNELMTLIRGMGF